jgi:hypothetical protein
MAFIIDSGFKVTSALPADMKSIWASSASLYSSPVFAGGYISASWRYDGMTVYCRDNQSEYKLIGGITDNDWIKITSGKEYISASYAPGSPTMSASYAETASYALNGGGSGTQLVTGSTYEITSSWSVSASWASSTLSASVLRVSRSINGVGFDGSSNITIQGTDWSPVFARNGADVIGYGKDIFTFVKTGPDGGWNTKVYSKQGYTSSLYASCKPTSINQTRILGLNSNPTDALNDYSDIDYGWYIVADGSTAIVRNGSIVGSFGNYTTNSVFDLTYDGTSIKYWWDNVLITSSLRAIGLPLYLDCYLNTANGSGITEVKFGQLPFIPTQNGAYDIGSTTKKFNNAYFSGSVTAPNFVGTASLAISASYVASASYYPAFPTNIASASWASSSLTASSADTFLVRNNLTVNGILYASQLSSSHIYITSSQLTVTSNILTLNALTPYMRYAGIEMYDSGSTDQLASFLWDGLNNYFFLSSSDAGYSRRIITGPDNEGILTNGYIPIATGSNGLIDSIISQNGNLVTIQGNISASSITASILGTASFAINALISNTSLYASQSQWSVSSSFASSSISASYVASASYYPTFPSNIASASWASSSISSSNSLTSSNLVGFNFNNTQSIISSINTQTIIIQFITGSYIAAFFDYAAVSASNIRSGIVFGSWVNGLINYTEVSNVDIGDTSPVTMSMGINGAIVQLSASANTSLWTIKALGRYL